ncbi:HNH endonuclease, partial [Acinetobacter baumannii]|nr:HNH endonuclease [Acinetobacter baumannii]
MKLTKQQRAELKQKFGGHCAYCGELLGDKWHADHIEAVKRDLIHVGGGKLITGE